MIARNQTRVAVFTDYSGLPLADWMGRKCQQVEELDSVGCEVLSTQYIPVPIMFIVTYRGRDPQRMTPLPP